MSSIHSSLSVGLYQLLWENMRPFGCQILHYVHQLAAIFVWHLVQAR